VAGKPASESRLNVVRLSLKCSYTHLQASGMSQSASGNVGASSDKNRLPSSVATAAHPPSDDLIATPWNKCLTPTPGRRTGILRLNIVYCYLACVGVALEINREKNAAASLTDAIFSSACSGRGKYRYLSYHSVR
jgi:hypothetical protein